MQIIDKKAPVISDFVVLFFIAAILIIDFLPYFKTIEIINPQFLYLSIINILMGIYFYFNQKSIAIEGISVLKKSYLTKLYLIFLFLCALSIFGANNVSLVITNFTQLLIVFLLFINLTILLKDKLDIFYKIVFIVCISAFFQSWQELYNLISVSNRSTVLEGLNQMKGNTGNINILAASLCIKIPFLLLGITHYTGNKKWFIVCALLLAITTIFLTGARAALVNLCLIFLIYVFYYLKTYSFNKVAFIQSSVLIVPVLISIFITSVVYEKSNDHARFNSLTKRIEQINTREESAHKRLTLWENTVKLSKTSPILGIGLGNYRIESIPYEKTTADDYMVSLHAHNDFLEIMAETGVINGLIYFSLFTLIFFINTKRIIKSDNKNTRTIALLTLLLVIVYGVDSVFNFPMYRPTMQIFLSLLFALTIVNNPGLINNKPSDTKNKSNQYSVIIILSAITCYSAFLLYKASNLEYLIETDDINKNTHGVLTGDEVINRLPLYPNVFGSSESFYEYAGIYYFREKNYEKAFKYFSRANKINPYLGRIDFYKHMISKERGNLDSAYVYIKQTYYSRPRDLYFYEKSINLAATKKDTLEILKEHKLFSTYRKIPQAWEKAAFALESSGYNRKKLLLFIDEGLKKIPNDSILLRQKKDFLITDHIIEGQKFASQSNFKRSLELYNEALKIDPENIYVMQNIGFHYYNQAQYKKAIDYLLNALKYPGIYDGQTEYYIAMSYMKINDHENACRYFNLSKTRNYPLAQQQIDQNCK